MADITEQMKSLLERETELARLIPDLEAEAVAHEKTAREIRVKYSDAKKEREQIRLALKDANVVRSTQAAEALAQKAQADAEAAKKRQEESEAKAAETLSRLEAKEKDLDAKSAKLDSLIAKAETPAE